MFTLTKAARPQHKVALREAYRLYTHTSPAYSGPALVALISAERIFDVFLALLEPLGQTVDVILESVNRRSTTRAEYYRVFIDLTVLRRWCVRYQDLLVNDGCTGINVLGHNQDELHWDEHKTIAIYALDLMPYIDILDQSGIEREDEVKLVSQFTHTHYTTDAHEEQFKLFRRLLDAESECAAS